MARAKNVSRAEARRRTRDSLRSELVDGELADDGVEETIVSPEPPRRPLFKMPDVRADLRALPRIFVERKLLWVPLLLLVIGFAAAMTLPGLTPEVASLASLYMQFFFIPPALFTFFIAGFVAPRASYLVGLLYGIIAGVMWAIVYAQFGAASIIGDPSGAPTPSAAPGNLTDLIWQMVMIGALYGTLAAAFAAWYRDFLRQMQERGRARRADKEEQERARRRTEKQEARRASKRPTT